MCGRYGHEEATSYEVIGDPPSWGSRGHGRGGRGGRASGKAGRANSSGKGDPSCETAAAVQEDVGKDRLDQAYGGPKMNFGFGGPSTRYDSNSA